MRTFLPKSTCRSFNGQFQPLYRWHQEDEWSLVPGRMLFPTKAEAIEAADDYLARGLNKKFAIVASIAAVFGDRPKNLFKQGRMIPVEYRGRRAE